MNISKIFHEDGFYPVYIDIFHDGGPCHVETSPLTCSANQWTSFYKVRTSIMKEFIFLETVFRVNCQLSLHFEPFSYLLLNVVALYMQGSKCCH